MSAVDPKFELRLRIESLLSDYVHAIDDDRLEAWPDFFTADGVYRVVTHENHSQDLPVALIYCNGAGMLRDRISALRTANIFEPQRYCHMVSAIRVLEINGAGYRVESNFTVTRTMANGDMAMFACGKYTDRVVEAVDGLKFAERTAILDSRRIDTLLVIPI